MMRWKVCAIAAALALAGVNTVSAQDKKSEDRSILTQMGSMLTFYGFLRVDAVYDTDHMNDSQLPTHVLSEDDAASGSNDFTIYTRLTRFGFDLDGGEVMDGHKLTGKLELDFYGSASDSRNEPRIRHAYLNLKKDELSLLAGQTWDLFSPLMPSANPDMLNWNAGNPGDRRPQIRFGYSPSVAEDSTLSLSAALAMQGAIDAQELDATIDGVIDGEDSGVPQIQARAAYGTKIMGESNSEVGAWLAYGQEESDAPVGSGLEDEWTASIYGIDVVLPITGELKVRGELWFGENADDFRGGIGQGINAQTGDEIAAMGYWAELTYALSKTTDVFVGYSVDDPDDDDLPTGTTTAKDLNELIYVGAQYRVWNPVRLGWEYIFWNTEYHEADDGTNNRFHVWIAYHF